jgi:hypothetical protein
MKAPKLVSCPHWNRAAEPERSVPSAVIDIDRVLVNGVAVCDRVTSTVARADIDQTLPALRAIEWKMSKVRGRFMRLHRLNVTDRSFVCNR